MSSPIVFMFSGQGSQYFHMAEELYQGEPVFRRWMDRLDQIAAEGTGASVLDYLYNRERKISDSFHDIRFSHPAIFMVEYSMTQVLLERGIQPDLVLGASMGEYAAAAVSRMVSAEDCLRMIVRQAAIFERTCPPGGMLTILTAPDLFFDNPRLYESCQLASVNYNSHFVVSGGSWELDSLEEYLSRQGMSCLRLPVDFGFHSSFIDAAEEPFTGELNTLHMKQPEIPFVSSMTGTILNDVHRGHFWRIVRQPVMTVKTFRYLEAFGSHLYLDLGPSGTMANFVKNNLAADSESQFFNVITPFGGELKKIRRLEESPGLSPRQPGYSKSNI